ncbi:carboxymuconolactone decarboxylase family protein [Cupriavidus sp. PET2-C1]
MTRSCILAYLCLEPILSASLCASLQSRTCGVTSGVGPALDHHARNIGVLSILTVRGRTGELKMHVRAALNIGLARAEIAEIFLHASMSCGIPAGSDATRVAKLYFAELDAH